MFGAVYPIVWKDLQNEAGGQLAVVKHVRIQRPHEGMSVQERREVEIASLLASGSTDNVVRMLRSIQNAVFHRSDIRALHVRSEACLEIFDGDRAASTDLGADLQWFGVCAW